MDLATFASLVQGVLDQVRSSLVAIEEAAQAEDRPEFHVMSQRYAGLIPPLRDYLNAAHAGRALPRHLSKRTTEALDLLRPQVDLIVELGLHPDLDELAAFVREAEQAG